MMQDDVKRPSAKGVMKLRRQRRGQGHVVNKRGTGDEDGHAQKAKQQPNSSRRSDQVVEKPRKRPKSQEERGDKQNQLSPSRAGSQIYTNDDDFVKEMSLLYGIAERHIDDLDKGESDDEFFKSLGIGVHADDVDDYLDESAFDADLGGTKNSSSAVKNVRTSVKVEPCEETRPIPAVTPDGNLEKKAARKSSRKELVGVNTFLQNDKAHLNGFDTLSTRKSSGLSSTNRRVALFPLQVIIPTFRSLEHQCWLRAWNQCNVQAQEKGHERLRLKAARSIMFEDVARVEAMDEGAAVQHVFGQVLDPARAREFRALRREYLKEALMEMAELRTLTMGVGIPDLLEKLRRAGYVCWILAPSYHIVELLLVLKCLKLEESFEGNVTLDDLCPNMDQVLETAVRKAGTSTTNVVVMSDHPAVLDCARVVGCRSVGLVTLYPAYELVSADVTCADVAQLDLTKLL
ncbi:hypothetical protein FVE85_0572 [Porphyridium purpureum]|uniref:Uncharacterized protein n=1 Tax=Porphyridium purpureum TaxID=35688 RepID=A0A5J4Z1T1_PORPP|nr:hypothetical protein FVE85_0572 [Porphyridium purpureum]|eukprot:POR0752..scf208_2